MKIMLDTSFAMCHTLIMETRNCITNAINNTMVRYWIPEPQTCLTMSHMEKAEVYMGVDRLMGSGMVSCIAKVISG